MIRFGKFGSKSVAPNTIYGAVFDGTNDSFRIAGGLTTHNSSWMTFGMKFRLNGIDKNQDIIHIGGNKLAVWITNGNEFRVFLRSPSSSTVVGEIYQDTGVVSALTTDTVYTVLAARQGTTRQIYINDTSCLKSGEVSDSGTAGHTATPVGVMGSNSATPNDKCDMDLRWLYWVSGVFIDLDVSGNRALFSDANMDTSTDGSEISATTPEILLNGTFDQFTTNKGDGGDLGFSGALTEPATAIE